MRLPLTARTQDKTVLLAAIGAFFSAPAVVWSMSTTPTYPPFLLHIRATDLLADLGVLHNRAHQPLPDVTFNRILDEILISTTPGALSGALSFSLAASRLKKRLHSTSPFLSHNCPRKSPQSPLFLPFFKTSTRTSRRRQS